ncbi:phosphate ABC transporter permease PstA [Thermofilum pendens]|uniref:Phosphate transport system permease protein PstA n=1 Tax=Thermofilum pendens (strain DSM 2475 / Hrk 5) TaxID=368408 RepID=A1RZ30_THEPD|nr:phosphate ABC transporter permease PstA [Thermofilum pendens]ABL78460.1 phosphate ABC transporter, inner membrane subunit PstA [Thermofilum pendens Hrk 5]
MNRRRLVNTAVAAGATVFSATVFLLIALLVAKPLYAGASVVLRRGISFFTEPPAPPGVGETGGVIYALLGTLLMTLIAVLVSSPLGVLTGIYVSEYPRDPLARLAEHASQFLSEVPSVLLGVFVYGAVVVYTKSPSLLAGALSLSLVVTPYIVVHTKEILSSIPFAYREAAFALGLPKWKTVLLVLLPMNLRGIASSLLAAYFRALGETAPVLFTAGAAFNGFYGLLGPSSTLSLLVWTYGQSPFENWQELAWGAAFILVAFTLAASIALRVSVREVRL